jgi:hypothetical protein
MSISVLSSNPFLYIELKSISLEKFIKRNNLVFREIPSLLRTELREMAPLELNYSTLENIPYPQKT